jgi:Xaa-Pro dipeptidase
MLITRRSLFAAAALAPLMPRLAMAQSMDTGDLQPITGDAVPIGREERAARLARAQALMKANGIGAVLIEPGASLLYFTGVRWGRSERLTAAVIPVEGDPIIVTPFFEEPSVRESLGIVAEIRVWQEHEDPFAVVAGFLRERKLLGRPLGIEETARFFAVDGMWRALAGVKIVSANPVVRGCRMFKTPAEIALMQKAADVTMAAYRWTYPRIEAGMTPRDIAALMSAATVKLGGEVAFNLILLGEASAYPHGTGKPQRVVKGEVVLMDCGARVHGYESDISRTFVHGEASAEQRKVWEHVRAGQQRAFAAAQIRVPAGRVDDAVRGWYATLGYGPDYKLPGLSHRTGHGIGMDGHEPINLVRGEMTKLAPGMCFSNEPGLYLPGKFGVRLEDCFHMTEAGPKWFSVPPRSIEEPIG